MEKFNNMVYIVENGHAEVYEFGSAPYAVNFADIMVAGPKNKGPDVVYCGAIGPSVSELMEDEDYEEEVDEVPAPEQLMDIYVDYEVSGTRSTPRRAVTQAHAHNIGMSCDDNWVVSHLKLVVNE